MRVTLIAACAVCILATAGSASAAHVHLVATPATVAPGAVVDVSTRASSCLAGDAVTLISAAFPGHAFGIGAAYGRARSHGAFSVSVRIRSGLRAGRYHVSVRCGGGNLGSLAYFQVR